MKPNLIIYFISVIWYIASFVWLIIEYSSYLYSQDPFNWISVLLFGLGFMIFTGNIIHVAIRK